MVTPAAASAPQAASVASGRGPIDAVSGALGFNINLGTLLAAVAVLVLAVVGSRLLRAGLARYSERHQASQSAIYALSRVLHYIIVTVGVLWALSIAGVPLTQFAVFAGAIGVGLGFGLQAIFSNFISGLIILFDRSIKVGDFIRLPDGSHGVVRDIQIRATRITTTDNIDILIPNSKFITDNVTNLTWRDTARRSHIPFRVPYGTDKEIVRKAVLEAAAKVPFTLTGDDSRKPQLWLTGFGESALECAMVVWLNEGAAQRYRGVMAAYTWALHDALEKYHLELPFPQRDLHVKSWPDGSGAQLPAAVSGTVARNAPPRSAATPSRNDAADSVSEKMAADDRGAKSTHDPDAQESGIAEQPHPKGTQPDGQDN